MFEPVMIICALLCGLIARGMGLPALMGYLGAGFLLHHWGAGGGPLLSQIADMGVTLLLFTIGLKLRPKELLEPRVWGTTTIHMLLTILLLTPLLLVLVAHIAPTHVFAWPQALLVAFALSFSSTVFAIQVLQERGEMASKHATLAIGVLLIQDIAAVLYIGASTGKVPDWTAISLLALIPLRKTLLRYLAYSGHGELFTLFGLAIALLGAELFELFGVKGDLGALLLGALLAGDQKAKELAKSLLQFKDVFLVGFFLTIGLQGMPATEMIIIAIILGLLTPLKAPLYFWLMARFHTQPRIALLSSATLANYSEFGLIVIAIATTQGMIEPEWSATLSLAIAVSFLLASAGNSRVHDIWGRWRERLQRFQTSALDDARPDTSGVRTIVLGMGHIGTGAYDAMQEKYGDGVIGVDENEVKLRRHVSDGRRVIEGDASDIDLWSLFDMKDIEQIMLALTNHEENKLVGKLLRDMGFEGRITAIVKFDEEGEELEEFGIASFNLFTEAGRGFADHAEAAPAARGA